VPLDGSLAPPVGWRILLGLAVLAASVLAAQIVLSRLFAATLGYYYAFMLISLAMLGLATGALIVQQRVGFLDAKRVGGQAATLSLLAGLAAYGGTLVALRVYPLAQPPHAFLGLAAVFCCFFPFFLLAGLAVSLVLWHARECFHQAYAADLTGAAAGSLAAVLALSLASPVVVALGFVAILPVLAAFFFALEGQHRGRRLAAGALFACLLGGSWAVGRYLSLADPSHVQSLSRPRVLVAWNAFSNVTVFRSTFFTWALSDRYPGLEFPMQELNIDGFGGTQIVQFDGRPESLGRYEYLDYDMTALGQQLVPQDGRQLIIGPGGGVDILQGVRRGRRDVTAVEINPLVASVVNDRLAAFSGSPYRLPGVRAFIENGRTFIKRSSATWDLISLTWVDAGGSATALAASENYLYTIEAYQEFLSHLSPNGYLAFMRGLGLRALDFPADTLRGVSVAVEALANLGVTNPGDHIVIAATRSRFFFRRAMCYVLVKKSAFKEAELATVRGFFSTLGFEALWLPGGQPDPQFVSRPFVEIAQTLHAILTSDKRSEVYRVSRWDIWPTTDDKPFYFAERGGPNRQPGEGIRILLRCCVLLAVLSLCFIGVPLYPILGRTERVGLPGAAFLAYCCFLGMAFMLVEIELFQLFALVLGNPAYALATVLVSLLVFSGTGALMARRLSDAGSLMLLASFGALLLLLAGLILGREWLLSALVVQPFALRILGTIMLIAPLAFCMGLPMALGMSLMRHRPDLMMWGWALNGAFSVLSSVGALLLAMHIGIARTFGIGLACYALAAAAIQIVRRRGTGKSLVFRRPGPSAPLV
jgi:hypothetical protein